MYTPEFVDLVTSFYWARTSDVPRVSQAGRDRTLEIERQRCRDQTQEFYFCAFGCHLNSSQMNRFEEGLKTFGGRLTGHRGPYPSSFQFQMNTCLWDEITWENWGVFIHNLEFHFRLNRQNSSLPQNRVSTPPKAIKIEQAQDSISPYKANLEAAGWTDLQDVELCTGRETWGCPPGGVCPRKVTHEDIQQYVEAKLMATRERINALLKALPGDIADPMQYATESVQQFGATVSELPEQVLRDFEGGEDE